MQVFGYGEDALTLWALTERTKDILEKASDPSDPKDCLVLYRPSFGRHGGPKSAQFGEFDFILATPNKVYLGESKWGESPEVKQAIKKGDSVVSLRPEQVERHEIFKQYFAKWRSRENWDWEEFLGQCKAEFIRPVPPKGSRLENNLEWVLKKVGEVVQKPKDIKGPGIIQNLLLIFVNRGTLKEHLMPGIGNNGFLQIVIDVPDGFVPLGRQGSQANR